VKALRWVVRPGDGATVGEVLARAGADPRAVADGRVFLGRIRVEDARTAVRPGDELTVGAARGREADVAVLLRGHGLLAVDKPAGVPTVPDHGGRAGTLWALAARVARLPEDALHPTSRLDRDVSGVVIFALTAEAAARLRRARGAGSYARTYVAIARARPDAVLADEGVWDGPIGRARDPRLRAVGGRDAVPARTRFRVVRRREELVWLELEPDTGRTHQLRVHASHAGAPLVGDVSYGGPKQLVRTSGEVVRVGRVALHCARVVVPGEDGAPLAIESPVPALFELLWERR
jgi:23S rRNA-/tRNA-specific pseudouridylate synthase